MLPNKGIVTLLNQSTPMPPFVLGIDNIQVVG
jgi:hypothetical protein